MPECLSSINLCCRPECVFRSIRLKKDSLFKVKSSVDPTYIVHLNCTEKHFTNETNDNQRPKHVRIYSLKMGSKIWKYLDFRIRIKVSYFTLKENYVVVKKTPTSHLLLLTFIVSKIHEIRNFYAWTLWLIASKFYARLKGKV